MFINLSPLALNQTLQARKSLSSKESSASKEALSFNRQLKQDQVSFTSITEKNCWPKDSPKWLMLEVINKFNTVDPGQYIVIGPDYSRAALLMQEKQLTEEEKIDLDYCEGNFDRDNFAFIETDVLPGTYFVRKNNNDPHSSNPAHFGSLEGKFAITEETHDNNFDIHKVDYTYKNKDSTQAPVWLGYSKYDKQNFAHFPNGFKFELAVDSVLAHSNDKTLKLEDLTERIALGRARLATLNVDDLVDVRNYAKEEYHKNQKETARRLPHKPNFIKGEDKWEEQEIITQKAYQITDSYLKNLTWLMGSKKPQFSMPEEEIKQNLTSLKQRKANEGHILVFDPQEIKDMVNYVDHSYKRNQAELLTYQDMQDMLTYNAEKVQKRVMDCEDYLKLFDDLKNATKRLKEPKMDYGEAYHIANKLKTCQARGSDFNRRELHQAKQALDYQSDLFLAEASVVDNNPNFFSNEDPLNLSAYLRDKASTMQELKQYI